MNSRCQSSSTLVFLDPKRAYHGALKGVRFVKNKHQVIRVDMICQLDLTRMDQFILKAQLIDGTWIEFERLDAIETILSVKPSAIEGHSKIRWKKHAWIIHNLIAHPLMQILALLRFTRLALWIHDVTVPGVHLIKSLKDTSKQS